MTSPTDLTPALELVAQQARLYAALTDDEPRAS